MAILVEGGLIVLAVGLAWWLEIPLKTWLVWNGNAVLWGVFATLPLCVIFIAAYLRPVGSYRRIKDFLLESLGPSLAACRWYELLLVAALAGIGEELLFRGVLQMWLERFGYLASLLISNVVFALCHAITITYAVLAFAMGLFLGVLLDAPAERSLLGPILTHGLYDFLAFCVLAVDWRKRHAASPLEAHAIPEDQAS
jgi:membrane protease YdiL (CAAX protease family)